MMLTLDTLRRCSQLDALSDTEVIALVDGVEQMIRSYTGNNFQNRVARFSGSSQDSAIVGTSPFIGVGDRVQITGSENRGLYTVLGIEEGNTILDGELYALPQNVVTRVDYPADVKLGALNLLKWEAENRDKVGVKSESLSRYSVTYYDQDAGNTVMGYPVSLLGFLKPYRRARF